MVFSSNESSSSRLDTFSKELNVSFFFYDPSSFKLTPFEIYSWKNGSAERNIILSTHLDMCTSDTLFLSQLEQLISTIH